jgi:hypothetical protein
MRDSLGKLLGTTQKQVEAFANTGRYGAFS